MARVFALTRLASPRVVSLVDVALGLGLADAEALGEAVAEAVGVALALAAGTILAEVLAVLVALADGEGVAFAVELGLAAGLALADGVAVAGEYGSKSRVWRKFSRAVSLTSCSVCWLVLPGTDTLRMSLPCVCTSAPVLPEAFTRDKMIDLASFR